MQVQFSQSIHTRTGQAAYTSADRAYNQARNQPKPNAYNTSMAFASMQQTLLLDAIAAKLDVKI